MSDVEVLWYVGKLLVAWATGWAGGTGHRMFVDLLKASTNE